MDKMIRKFLFTWMVFLFFAFSENANAVYYSLSDGQIRQAIEYGENSKDTDYFAFLDEWTTVAGDGYEWATLNTKFGLLAYEARRAALESRKLTQTEIIQFPWKRRISCHFMSFCTEILLILQRIITPYYYIKINLFNRSLNKMIRTPSLLTWG